MIEPGPFSLVVLPLLFGLFGFLEPCTKDSALVMVRQIERRSPQRKPVQMTISAPARALFLVISHAPGRLLPTIRSRCRRLDLAPLAPEAIVAAIRENGGVDANDDDLALAATLAEGSLRRAILLLEGDGIDTYRDLARLATGGNGFDVSAMHALADKVSGRGANDAYDSFLETVRGWLGRRVRGEPEPIAEAAPGEAIRAVPLARWAEVWEKVTQSSTEAEDLNLDRKQVVLSILMSLARAARM